MSQDKKIPYGNIESVEDIGKLVRAHRKSQSATQAEFAALCGVGVRFISDLENGKQTIELGKALHVLKSLGLEISIQPRGWKKHDNTQPLASDR
ncbi:helix-turn-helix transcriptional regulator [Methylophaga sp. OBS4]|uniref:helix-turn-helix transcriptional regulator n=1 Tax=Methylophaga sp. OBS4 TaxID=2991935 RepID=UPI00224D6118|nr:helix-turn-helix transcriptional regulator [Methylophaga sp. OBS4]MCX4186528.1 helix-turn-helix transcriptional regulator [Methylophaga sp. OBS4]